MLTLRRLGAGENTTIRCMKGKKPISIAPSPDWVQIIPSLLLPILELPPIKPSSLSDTTIKYVAVGVAAAVTYVGIIVVLLWMNDAMAMTMTMMTPTKLWAWGGRGE